MTIGAGDSRTGGSPMRPWCRLQPRKKVRVNKENSKGRIGNSFRREDMRVSYSIGRKKAEA
jgi:hypothetical protein